MYTDLLFMSTSVHIHLLNGNLITTACNNFMLWLYMSPTPLWGW